MKLDLYLPMLIKVKLKWIKYLHLRPETIKLPGENVGKNFLDIGLGNDSLDKIRNVQATKVKITKWKCIKSKSLLQQRKQSINCYLCTR